MDQSTGHLQQKRIQPQRAWIVLISLFEECFFEFTKLDKQVFASGRTQACVLRHFGLLLLGCAHNERWNKHNAASRNHFEIVNLHAKHLVVKERQAQAQSTIQVLRGCALLDRLDNLSSLESRQRATLDRKSTRLNSSH